MKADKEIGGDKFDANMESARRIIEKYGDEQIKNDLNVSGFGNYPPLVRLFAKLGKLMNEGQILSGKPVSEKPKGPKSLAEALYPDKPTLSK